MGGGSVSDQSHAGEARVPTSPWPGADLRAVVEGAVGRWGWLLSAGEVLVLRRVLALSEPGLELYARLTLRAGAVFRERRLAYAPEVVGAAGELEAAGLIDRRAPDRWVLPCFTAAELAEICRDRGVSARGRRAELEARVGALSMRPEPVILVRHRGLIRRAERLFFQRGWIDRAALLQRRAGRLVFAAYGLTGGAGCYPDRRALRAAEGWAAERVAAHAEAAGREVEAGPWEVEEARVGSGEALRSSVLAGPGVLGGAPWSAEQRNWARAAEVAAGRPGASEDIELLAAMVAGGLPERAGLARALERAGRLEEAWAQVRAGLAEAGRHPAQRIAVERVGRRLGRRLGRGVAPRAAPEVVERRLQLRPGARQGGRPGWEVGGRSLTVEAAAVACLAEAGVAAWHVEGRLWTSLFALCMRELYWLPVAGALPAPMLAGPLDLGYPAFYQARAAEVEATLTKIRREGVAGCLEGYRGEVSAGLSLPVEQIAAMLPQLARISGEVVAAVLGALAREGWSAASGLPDLLVLSAGERCPGLLPERLPERPCLVEIKGPGDDLQDNQRAWLERLSGLGAVEVWRVGA